MFKNLLSSVEFFEIWSEITMIIFLISFLYIIFYTVKMDKKHESYMSSLPIDKEINNNN
jgi:uncharacterized membrane protein YjfL (UPF0719 family)